MNIAVDVAKEGTILWYYKDLQNPAIMVGEGNLILVSEGSVVDPGLPSQKNELRVIVPVGVVSTDRLRAIASAVDYASSKGYHSGCLVVQGDKIGFISVG